MFKERKLSRGERFPVSRHRPRVNCLAVSRVEARYTASALPRSSLVNHRRINAGIIRFLSRATSPNKPARETLIEPGMHVIRCTRCIALRCVELRASSRLDRNRRGTPGRGKSLREAPTPEVLNASKLRTSNQHAMYPVIRKKCCASTA